MARKSKQAVELESQVGDLELKLASQNDLLKRYAAENDQLKLKVRQLTARVSVLLKDKQQLELSINRLSKK